jgi:TolA-binding protein
MKALTKLWSELSAQEQLSSHREELDSQKVELSVIGELNKLAQAAKDLQGDLERSEQELKDLLDAMSNIGMQAGEEMDYAEKLDDDLETVIREAADAAQRLGLDSVPEIDDAVERRANLRKAYNDAYALWKKLDF